MIIITKPDGSALSSVEMTAQRGIPSSHLSIAIENTGASTVQGAEVIMYAESSPSSGDFVTRGHPVVDERWGRLQVTSVDSSGTPGQEALITAAQIMGYLSNGILPEILAGNIIFADIWLEQPSVSSGGGAVNLKFEVAKDGPARAVEEGVTMVGRGIDSGVNQPKSYLISGRLLTASGSPDDKVHVAAGSWLYQGTAVIDASSHNLTLNQNDSLASALVAGESYYAAISQGLSTTPTVTKGVKSASTPAKPSVPFGESLIGFALVAYGGSGSVISSGDLEDIDLSYGRYAVTFPATGLTATVHPGEALTANFHQIRSVKGDVVLINSTNNLIWLEATGAVTVVTGTADAPSPGALLLRTLTTSGGNVTVDVDNRTYIGQAGALSLHASTHATGGSDPVSPGSIGAATTGQLALKADLAGPVFSGDPQAPTPSPGDNSASIPTTSWVQGELAAILADHFLAFPGDNVSQPATLSPVPASGCIVLVDVNGQIVRSGGGGRYTDDGVGNIVFTPVLDSTEVGGLHWRG